jgi:hypothetical protein
MSWLRRWRRASGRSDEQQRVLACPPRSPPGAAVILFFLVNPLPLRRTFVRTLVALGAALFLAACSTVESPRSSSNSPTVRCVDGPGRGQSLSDARPLFFLFCVQSP